MVLEMTEHDACDSGAHPFEVQHVRSQGGSSHANWALKFVARQHECYPANSAEICHLSAFRNETVLMKSLSLEYAETCRLCAQTMGYHWNDRSQASR